jgi:ABC-type protease/lipase transport system fused ATPase/permease subunit
VIAAARLAGAHEMILKLPNAYETEVGVHGAYLSGGQKQRIGLARALLREPPLIILDEPALNLDAEGEMQLIKAIAELKKRGHTMVVVAHQPKILRSADKILLLRDGLVHAFGPRDEVFRSLMAVQGGKSDTPAGSIQVGAAE